MNAADKRTQNIIDVHNRQAALRHQITNLTAAVKAGKYLRNKQRDQIAELKAVVEDAITGIEWYRAEHPESDSGTDDEFLQRAREAIK